MAGQTSAIEANLAARAVTLEAHLPEERLEGPNATPMSPEPASPEAREAILRSLYAERVHLTRARRLGELSQHDTEYLAEIEATIDYWETAEAREAAAHENVWRQLEDLAGSLLSVQAAIEQQRR